MIMREIKFRAWDKSFKIMSKPFQGELVIAQDQIHSLTELLREDNWHVMQFTGLTDKNGTEIYEGDRLTQSGVEAIIEFSGGQFFGRLQDGTETELPNRNWLQWKIIGNVHESA